METSSQVLKLIKLPNIRDDRELMINHHHLKMMKSNNVCANATDINGNGNGNGNGRSFLQFLSNISSTPKVEKENAYFHPLSKSTSSRLSEKSLQLCTENLGCETGSFIMDTNNINFMSLSSPYHYYPSPRKEQQVVEEEEEGSHSIKKVKSYSAFPPPLTTMSGEKSLQIRTNREGGRLITKAFEIPNQESCFVADRSDGRLRLRVYKDFGATNVDHDHNHVQAMSTQEENEGKDVVDENEMMMYKEEHDDECQNTDTDDDDDDEDADDDYGDDEGENCKKIMSNEIVVESSYDIVELEKMGKEKFPRRLVRCKECSKGLGNNWEPLWVATS